MEAVGYRYSHKLNLSGDMVELAVSITNLAICNKSENDGMASNLILQRYLLTCDLTGHEIRKRRYISMMDGGYVLNFYKASQT